MAACRGLRMQFTRAIHSGNEMVEPKISIVIPTYNRGHFIGDAIRSALNQEHGVHEVLVVDDGSEDDTEAVVRQNFAGGVRYIAKRHSGIPDTRNAGIFHAEGDFLLWLDSDDVLLPGTVGVYLGIIRSVPSVDVLYGDLIATDPELRPRHAVRYEDWFERNAELLGRIICLNPLPNPGTMVRKSCYERIGPYSGSFQRAEDLEWWLRGARSLRFKHAGTSVVKWRQSQGGSASAEDFHFTALAVKEGLRRYSLRELFPQISWETLPREQAEGEACMAVAMRLSHLKDIGGAISYMQRSVALFPSKRALAVMQYLSQVPAERG